MFDGENEQDDFFSEWNSDFNQQDFDDSSADFFNDDSFNSSMSSNIDSPQMSDSPDDFFNNEGGMSANIDSPPPVPQVKFGYKTVGLVVALFLVILALLILGLSNISLVKKTNKPQQQSTQQATRQEVSSEPQRTTERVQEPSTTEQVQVQERPTQNNSGLVPIPSNTHIDYSSEAVKSQGVVSNLSKYLQDGQVIYCVDIDISVGISKSTIHYYCGYNVFSQVNIGDVLTVEYQQVSDNCFSVCTITK